MTYKILTLNFPCLPLIVSHLQTALIRYYVLPSNLCPVITPPPKKQTKTKTNNKQAPHLKRQAFKYCRSILFSLLPIHFGRQFHQHAAWMQIVQLCTHDVIIISSVNNERVQLHTNRRVQSARDCGWMEIRLVYLGCGGRIFFFDWPAYSQSWIIRFIQNRHVKKSPHIQGHGWDYRKSGAYRVTVSVGVRDIHPKGTSLLNDHPASIWFKNVGERFFSQGWQFRHYCLYINGS